MAEWKYRFENREFGPFDTARMRHFARLGVIHADTEVRRTGMLGWAPYKTLAHEIETGAPQPQAPEEKPEAPEPAPHQEAPDRDEPDAFGIDPREAADQSADLRDIGIGLAADDQPADDDPWRSEPTLDGPSVETPYRRRNYVARHWRGELSFAVSCLVNGLVPLLLIAGLLVFMVRHGIVISPRPQLLVPLSVIAGCFGLWQIVGIWRAAGHSGPSK